jgi:ferritin-like metal-binding protein YciE
MASNRKSTRSSKKDSPDATELLVLELQEIHSAESQLSRMLPRLGKSARSETLSGMLETRQAQGQRLIEEIESSLEEMEDSPGRKKNVAAEGLINDLREHVQEIEQGPALDAVLIAGIQKTEHYCIAAWGTAKSLGEATGQTRIVKTMERVLKEGKTLDEELTQLAEREITPALTSGTEEDESGEDSGDSGNRSRKSRRSENRTSS